jgi:hypothetical protein
MIPALVFLAAAAVRSNIPDVHALADVLKTFRAESHVRVVNVWATWCSRSPTNIAEAVSR